MKITEPMKEAALKVGMAMAKVDINTTCLWINYQSKEPKALTKMRSRKNLMKQ